MTSRTGLVSIALTALMALGGLVWTGCGPSLSTQLEEEKEPHFLEGKSRVNALDYKGAIESFEKALDVNPRSASAHFELGWLLDEKDPDPAAAIYHYQSFLKLRPNADRAVNVKARILTCKQELTRSVSLGPVTQSLQNEFERLNEDNKRLREDVEKWRAYAMHLQTLTNQWLSAPRAAHSTTAGSTPTTIPISYNASASAGRPAATPAAGARTHTVKPGETPVAIARRYGVRLEALMAANPRVDARRMQVGQPLNIPAL
jgi:tetratricopeptide (TPR) repeat protein